MLGPTEVVCKGVYPDLLREIRKNDRSVLIGNPGIGKSFFQYYYLKSEEGDDQVKWSKPGQISYYLKNCILCV